MIIQRVFIALVVLVAVVAGILAMSLPRDSIAHLVMFRDFFDMALPILAFGALVKYLCACCCVSHCKCGTANCNGKCGSAICATKCNNCGSTNCTCKKVI